MATTLNRDPFTESARELSRWASTLRWRLAHRLFDWAVPHKDTWWAKQLPNLISSLRVFAPFASARAIRALKRRDYPAFALWSSVAFALFALDAIDGPASEMLEARSRFGAWLDSNADKWAFLHVLRQVHNELKIHEVGFEAFASALLVAWRQYVDYGLAVVSTEATLRGFDNRAKRAGKLKFRFDVASLVAGYAAMLAPDRFRTPMRRIHRTLIVVAIGLGVASLVARLQSRGATVQDESDKEQSHENQHVA